MLGERIKELRTAFGMSQVTLAEKTGVTKQCVSNWENGYIQPSIDALIKLTEVFSAGADYMLGLTNKRTIDITGLTDIQIARIQGIVDDIRK